MYHECNQLFIALKYTNNYKNMENFYQSLIVILLKYQRNFREQAYQKRQIHACNYTTIRNAIYPILQEALTA